MNDTVGSCYKLTPYWGNLWRPLDDPDYPWLGLWTSLFITAVWYFCTDQVYASSIPQGPNSSKVLMIDISLRFSTWSRSWSGALDKIYLHEKVDIQRKISRFNFSITPRHKKKTSMNHCGELRVLNSLADVDRYQGVS